MIERRVEHEKKEWTDSYGNLHVREASYEIRFIVGRYEIAYYNSGCDMLFLKTNLILCNTIDDMKKPYSERIKGSEFESEFKQLLSSYKNVSEYMRA